jgi:hypothetical protein
LGYVTLRLAEKDGHQALAAAENIKTGSDFGAGGYIVKTEVLNVPLEGDDYLIAISAPFEASPAQDLEAIENRVKDLAEIITPVANSRYDVEHDHPRQEPDRYTRGLLMISNAKDPSADGKEIMTTSSIYRNGDANVGVLTRADVVTDGANGPFIVCHFIAYTGDTVPVMEERIRAIVGPEATITRFTVQEYIGHPILPQRHQHMGREELHQVGHSHGNSAG